MGRLLSRLHRTHHDAVAEELEPPEFFTWFKKKRESIGIRIEPLNSHAGTILLSTLREAASWGSSVIGICKVMGWKSTFSPSA